MHVYFGLFFLSLLSLCHHHACITESLTLKIVGCHTFSCLFYFHDFTLPAITRSENKNNVEFSFDILNYCFAFDDNCAHLKYTKNKRTQMFAKNTYFPKGPIDSLWPAIYFYIAWRNHYYNMKYIQLH